MKNDVQEPHLFVWDGRPVGLGKRHSDTLMRSCSQLRLFTSWLEHALAGALQFDLSENT